LATAATLVALVGGFPIHAAHAQLVTEQPFSGFSTGTQLSANLVHIGNTQVLNAQQANAGASVNSKGLGSAIANEMGQVVQPALASKDSYGRGDGLEIGALTNFPEATELNQLLLSGLAQAAAPPPEGPITKQIAVDLPPVGFAGLLKGRAQAIFDPATCPLGQPLSYGEGDAANVQLLPSGPNGPGGLINTASPSQGQTTAQSRSFEYLIPNGDGTFGLVSETHQILAPIVVAPTPAPALVTIRVDGEFVMRMTARGKPGMPPGPGPYDKNRPPQSSIEFSDPLIVINVAGTDVVSIRLSQILATGIHIPNVLGLVGPINVGGPPRAIGSFNSPTPALVNPDGTSVSAAYDLIGLGLLQLVGGVNLRVGHMEGAVQVPPGGLRCNIPVSKTAQPDPATAGQDVTVTISIPDDPKRFAQLFACDLINISATDKHEVLEGNPRFHIVSASNGGQISGNTVTWPNLGNYARGSPPIVVTVVVHIDGGSGRLKDTVNVAATLGNCTGGIAGQDIVGSFTNVNAAVSGTLVHLGPEVGRGNLPPTGGNMTPLVAGGALLAVALGARQGVRRIKARSPGT
jgi:hypothetical protein